MSAAKGNIAASVRPAPKDHVAVKICLFGGITRRTVKRRNPLVSCDGVTARDDPKRKMLGLGLP